MDDKKDKKSSGTVFLRWLGRLAIITIVLIIVSYFTPGFRIIGIWSFVGAALVINILDYFIEKVLGIDAAPYSKGIKGFFVAALILYITQFIVPNMNVTIIGAIIAALLIGVLDAIFPARIM